MKTCHYCHAYYRGAHCEACMTHTGQPQASTQALLAAKPKPMPCVGDSIVYPGDPIIYTIRELALTPQGPIALIESGGTSYTGAELVLIDDLQEVPA